MTENEEHYCSEKKRNWKNLNNYTNLLLGDKVEVRSVEKEYEGSWHTGTVIACEDQSCEVQYDHHVCTVSSNKLIRTAEIPNLIRPLPPPLNIDENTLRFGQCVDAYCDEAWSECVIFYKNDGSEKILVFFPDTGHEVYFTRNNLRITQDWDGCSGQWKPRKNWFFLDLIEELKQEWPLQVSVKQIWSEVREEEGFQKDLKRWTSERYGLWRNLVWKVYSDNLKLCLNHFFLELGDAAYKPPLSFSEGSFDMLKPKSHSSSFKMPDGKPASVNENKKYLWLPASRDIVPEPEFCPDSVTDFIRMYSSKERPSLMLRQNLRKHLLFLGWKIEFMRVKEKLVYMYTSPEGKSYGTLLEVCKSLNGENPDPNPELKIEGFSCNDSKISPEAYKKRKNRREWVPADHLSVPKAEFCPDAIHKFNLLIETKRRGTKSLILDVRKHLSFLGWKIEFFSFKGHPKLRYTSPDGASFTSLSAAVPNLSKATDTFSVPNQNIEKIVCKNLKGENSDPDSEPKIEELSCYGSNISPRKVYKKRSHICGSADHGHLPKAELLPDAIKEYNMHMKTRKGVPRSISVNVRKHLLFLGWKMEYRRLKGAPRLRYTSPDGTSFVSLSKALQNLPESTDTFSVPCQNKAAIVPVLSDKPQPCSEAIEQYYFLSDVKRSNYSKTFEDPENLEVKMKAKKHLMALGWSMSFYRRASGKREPLYVSTNGKKFSSLRRACKACIDKKCVSESNSFIPMVEESANADEDGLTLSKLMLKRNLNEVEVKDITKVRKGAMKRKNRVTALDSDLLHKKGKKVEAKHLKKRKKCTSSIKSDLRKRPRVMKDRWDPEKSDDICSLCHNGGELMLCDQCPSAFHTMCLGLQCVPDGEWFCPACCCGICGRGGFSSDTKEFGDKSVLSCDQCEHKYHVVCLRLKGLLKSEASHKENWFCNERCEQIYLGLHNLLGKSVPVGDENITWTLLKYTKSSDCDQNAHAPDENDLEANYNKFNIALSVMHECFEPSKERKTRRDVLEDVIFSRWSELKRLNFQGFYTVLLEKNGEVITVASVRVHGEKVAELPFIGTQFKYRRHGMCRMLMNELENKLMELGVQRLVLPAVPDVLNTWIESFQFSKMTELERLNFLDYIFLDFRGTTLCQKILGKMPSCLDHLEPEQTMMTLSENVNLDENIFVSRVVQSDPVFPVDKGDLEFPIHETNPVENVETVDQGASW